MSVPQTQNWSAVESSKDFAGSGRNIAVNGQVEVGSPADTVYLREQEGPLGSPVMTLDMSIEQGTGSDVMTWKDAKHARDLGSEEHFSEVEVRFDGQVLETIPVQIIPS